MSNALFQDQGFYIATDAIPQEALAGIRDVLADALGKSASATDISLDDLIMLREREDHNLVYQASLCVGSSASAYQLIGDRSFLDLISNIANLDLRNTHIMPLAVQVQLPGDQRFDYKWHQESTYYPWCPDVLTIWFPIVRPSKRADGTMAVIPGSHRDGQRDARTYFSYQNFRQIEPQIKEVEAVSATPIEINVGDICVFDANMVHCSEPNLTKVPRVTGILRLVNFDKMASPRPLYKALSLTEVEV